MSQFVFSDPEPEPALAAEVDDLAFVDRLEERVRQRTLDREASEGRARTQIVQAQGEVSASIRSVALRRLMQFAYLAGDLGAALLGRSARVATGTLEAVTQTTETAAATLDSYRENFRRRLLGRVTLYRLERMDSGLLDRTALVCDRVDLGMHLATCGRKMPAIVIGRFDRTRVLLGGVDLKSHSLAIRTLRRPEGDLFVVRDALGHWFPPLPAETMLLLLSHHDLDDTMFAWPPILRRMAAKAGTTAILLQWNGELSKRLRRRARA